MNLEDNEKRLLNLIQAEFPLTRRPWDDLALKVGADSQTVMDRIAALKEKGIIRSIGPVVDARKLGYQSTLVAMRVPEAHLEKAEKVIADHPGVSHGYERDHWFNVWFTLALPPEADVDQELTKLSASTGAEAAVSLPATRLFKIGAYFDVEETGQGHATPGQGGSLSDRVRLSETEKRTLKELQQDLPLVPEPFTPMAETVGIALDDFLSSSRGLLHSGVVRRFSASINHRRAGFTANAMTCWAVPDNRVEKVGNRLAELKEVSHCYERKANGPWRHNVFAMIHGRSKELCQSLADAISSETGISDYELLYSTKEFKKSRIRYLA